MGIELDYIPGAEQRAAQLLAGHDFDYVVGSVHFIAEGAVDMEEYGAWARQQDPDLIWGRYFEALADAARSGLFDILAHPDLVKVWGAGRPGPDRDRRHFYEPAVAAIAESGVAVEISTAGLRKPVGEIYPAPAFAEMCAEAGVPFALSSDAHAPEQVGYAYDQALRLLDSLEVTEISVFERRRRRLEPVSQAQKRENPGP
jgi:histidinol-phosphatase (PHP family)